MLSNGWGGGDYLCNNTANIMEESFNVILHFDNWRASKASKTLSGLFNRDSRYIIVARFKILQALWTYVIYFYIDYICRAGLVKITLC